MTFYDAVNPQTGGPTTGSPISAFTHIRRKGRLLGFLFLVLALGAALLVAVDSEPRPAFADSLAYQLTQGFLVAIMKAEADIHISIHGGLIRVTFLMPQLQMLQGFRMGQ